MQNPARLRLKAREVVVILRRDKGRLMDPTKVMALAWVIRRLKLNNTSASLHHVVPCASLASSASQGPQFSLVSGRFFLHYRSRKFVQALRSYQIVAC